MKNITLIFILILIYLMVDFLGHKYLLNSTSIIKALSTQMETSRIDIKEYSRSWELSFTRVGFIIFYTITKVSVSFFVILVGYILSKVKIKLPELFFRIAIAEGIYILQISMEILHFNIFVTDFNLKELLHHSPFSLLTLWDVSSLPEWAIYPLENIGIFELIYILTISYLTLRISKTSFNQNFKIVFSSYSLGLLLWFSIHILFKIIQ